MYVRETQRYHAYVGILEEEAISFNPSRLQVVPVVLREKSTF
jgi:hypothetical protein